MVHRPVTYAGAYERTSVRATPGSEKPSHIEGICASVRASARVWRRLTEILDSGRVALWREGDGLPPPRELLKRNTAAGTSATGAMPPEGSRFDAVLVSLYGYGS